MDKDNMLSLLKELNYHKEGLSHILILNGGRISSSSKDNTLIIYNKNTFKPDIIIEHLGNVNYFIQLRNTNIVTCSWDHTSKIIQLFPKKKYKIIQTLREHTDIVTKAIELEDGKLLTVGNDKFIIVWKQNPKNNNLYEVEKKLKCSIYENPYSNIVLINNDLLLCTSMSDYTLRFYEINNNFQLAFYFNDIDFSFSRNSILYINEKDLLLVGGKDDNGIYLFKLKKIPAFIGKFSCDWINKVNSIILLEDGDILMGVKEKNKEKEKGGEFGGDENEKYSYSICKFGINENKFTLLDKVKNAHKDLINGMIYWKKYDLFLSCSGDRKIKIWKMNKK